MALVAPIKEQVHPQADAEERHPISHGLAQRIGLAACLHRRHRIGESAHAGQHHTVGGQDVSGAVSDARIVTRIGKAALHAS